MWIYVFWSCICVFLYMCICVFAILDTHNYHLWGPVLSRNHCRQTFILYIRVYMPSADCTLLRSRGGGGGAIFLKVHLPGCESQLVILIWPDTTESMTKEWHGTTLTILSIIKYTSLQNSAILPKYQKVIRLRAKNIESRMWWSNILQCDARTQKVKGWFWNILMGGRKEEDVLQVALLHQISGIGHNNEISVTSGWDTWYPGCLTDIKAGKSFGKERKILSKRFIDSEANC